MAGLAGLHCHRDLLLCAALAQVQTTVSRAPVPPTCRAAGGCCTNYSCDEGLYCPFEQQEANPACKRCPSPQEAQRQGMEVPRECQPQAGATDGGR